MRAREARTVELDETLALLAVDHRDGGLLATEALDLMREGVGTSTSVAGSGTGRRAGWHTIGGRD